MAQDKLKIMARTAEKFMRAADKLCNRIQRYGQTNPGSAARQKASLAMEMADAVYAQAHDELDAVLKNLA